MEKDFFAISDNPLKGIEIELLEHTIVIPPLALVHYVEQEADKKIERIIKFHSDQELEKSKALTLFQDFHTRINKDGLKSLTDEEKTNLNEAMAEMSKPVKFDTKILNDFFDVVLMAAKRNYPNLTKEVLMNELDFELMKEILPILQSQDKSAKKFPMPQEKIVAAPEVKTPKKKTK